ncbi:hypothetical protein D3C72_946190 [compost metagenome]
MVADVAVDGVREVDHRGATWQRHDLALGREDVDGVGEQVDLDVVPELGGVACLVLDVEQRLQPLGAQPVVARGVGLGGLVEPVRRHARFGHDVHGLGAQLELHAHAGRAHQRGVQRLVAVELGDRDVVLELARQRLVHLVQDAQAGVAGDHVRHDEPEAVDVGDLREAQVFFFHLAVDGIERFLAARDAQRHAGGGEGRLDLFLHLLDQVASSSTGLGDGLGQRGVAPGLEVAERQVLQFAVGLVQAQPVRDGGVDLERFARDAGPLFARRIGQRAHVVRAVGQLDQDDAHVARHGQQHLAEGLGLVLFARVGLQLVELGEPVDQLGNRGAEALDELRLGDTAVLDGIVQQRGHERLGVELPFGALRRHGDGVGDVRLAAVAQLPEVGLVGEAVGPANQLGVFGAQVVEAGRQGSKTRGGRVQRRRTRFRRGGRRFGDRAHGYHFSVTALWTRPDVKKAPQCGAFSLRGCVRSARHFLEHLDADLAFGDFAQGRDGGLVLALDLGGVALAQHARTVRGGENELETVRDLNETIFDGDAGHDEFFRSVSGDFKGCSVRRTYRHGLCAVRNTAAAARGRSP